MALAKYFEDIEDRWLEDTAGRYESRVSELLDLFPPRAAHAGEVYLARSGRRMEDIEVCEVGQTLDLDVVSTPGTAEPLVEVEEDSGRRELRISSSGGIKVPFKKRGTHRLQVSSGGYIKPYSIQVVEPFQVEQMPDFAKLIQSLADNPPQWTEKTFDQFRVQLEAILGKAGVPELFVHGIIEYHLGLFHEELRLPAFRERFHAAYGCLRWFIPYSDIARLICAYYLYCANEFEAAAKLCSGWGSRLGKAIVFYSKESTTGTSTGKTKQRTKAGLPLLLAMADVLTFQAIEAIDDDRVNDATELAAVIRRQTIPAFDRERIERLRFLEACAREQSGDRVAAKPLFETLQESPWQAIASAASNRLK
jgi:hypothetical protein